MSAYDAAMVSGGRMYRTVFEYASLGEHHRTGTPEDAATLDWFEANLRAIGATTERLPWTFERYEATWSLTADGEEIESLPLFYEGTGEVATDAPVLLGVGRIPGTEMEGFGEAAERAMTAGATAGVLVATNGVGDLRAINRRPVAGSGLPALCVGWSALDALSRGPVRLEMSARVVPGTSSSIVARIGEGPDEERLMLTTPLSGWFRCAGERGTGIAVTLALAEALAARGVPLLVNGNSGHELEDYGAHRYLETMPEMRALLHIGASVAAGEPDFRRNGLALTKGLRVRAWTPGREKVLTKTFKALGVPVEFIHSEAAADPSSWVGESRVWCQLGRPMVSLAGGFSLFHTSGDLPARATSPALLEATFAAALDVCEVLAHA